ncbi:MAG: cytochrome P450 [Rhodothermales bacterium]
MSKSELPDPFEQARVEKGYGKIDDQNDPVTMILRHRDVRKCAHNWSTFSSDAGEAIGRIVVPSEVHIRSTRQIPFEVDPPEHGAYRAIVEPWFKRPLEPAYQEKLAALISSLLDEVLEKGTIEAIYEFSLLLQSRALTLLLNVPFEEAETYIGWGTHVFRSEDDPLDNAKAQELYNYIDKKMDEAEANPGDDMFSGLLNADYKDRKLTREEVSGIAVLTFAGGRDTVINMVTNTLAYLAEHPESIERLRNEPDIRVKAIEELLRYFAPLTHMGRVVKENTEICGRPVEENTRISLCWASANRDASVFEDPNTVNLDRKANPHLTFGFGTHNCLGATHARQIMRTLIPILTERVNSIDIMDCKENIENWRDDFQRKVGYDRLTLQFNPR